MLQKVFVSFLAGSMLSVSLFAQSGNSQLIGRYVMTDPRGGVAENGVELRFDDEQGYGIAVATHFWPAVSVEVAASRAEPEVIGRADDLPVDVTLGSVEMTPVTATLRYHFMPHSRISPYVGAGVAYVLYDALRVEDETIDFEDSFGYLASAGVDLRVTDFIGINFDAKYLKSESETSIEGDPVTLDFEVDPLITSVGVSLRF